MAEFRNPYISNVKIKNYKNFLNVDVSLGHKQVIIGENNVGKTNFLRALQLILDKDFSDNDRQLTAEDFHDSIENPMENGEEIEIILQIRGYEHSRKLVAQFSDAVISDTPPTLQITYRYFPNRDEQRNILNYQYEIFKGNSEERKFTNEDRSYINVYVIKALRDVERELRANKNSPLYKLVKQYEISADDLQEISDALKEAADGILELDEIVHIKNTITDRFSTLSGLQTENRITLRTFDVDTERLLYTLQVYMGLKERPVSELSLGLANILYISLMLILLKDRTIMPIIKPDQFESLQDNDKDDLLSELYEKSENGNYILKKNIALDNIEGLYSFMDEYNYRHQAFTILAVEEPEAHLHPVLQRLIYREVLYSSNTSVIFTSHSTYITSVSPLNSIVHVRRIDNASQVFSTVELEIEEKERWDMERYVDAKRGEIYFGKAIILAEGITEEYIIPAAASLLGIPLDDYGVVVCNIDSTNFFPYVRILNALSIPWVLFTDGDYYELRTVTDEKSGKSKKERVYHIMKSDGDSHYLGLEIVESLLTKLGVLQGQDIPEGYDEQDSLFQNHGCFIGRYTLEVDLMDETNEDGIEILKNVYKELKPGGREMQQNFESVLDNKDYWSALEKIDGNISKGRFAQRLASELTTDMIPEYLKEGLRQIIEKAKESYE